MKTAVIMPTIRVPENTHAWAEMLTPDVDEIIVAGNGRSPHEDIIKHLAEVTTRTGVVTGYIHPDDPEVRNARINDFLPLNHTNRRNLALLQALRGKPDVVVTIDDDNFPKAPSWLTGVHALLADGAQVHRPIVQSSTGWWNAGELCRPPVVHRGFPVSRWREVPETTLLNEPVRTPQIGVVASLWLGDPDINAAERMVNDPEVVHISGSVVLARGTWCPFDSQSTAVRGDLAPMLFMWPDVGRYDDIWSSYVMRAVMDITDRYVSYGLPAVVQKRNPHKLVRDLKDELLGYEHTEALTDYLRNLSVSLPTDTPSYWSAWRTFYWFMDQLKDCNIIPTRTRASFGAWLADIEDILNAQLREAHSGPTF